jgi:hypothetical protein
VAVQLEGLPGQPQRPGLARSGPPHHHGDAGATLGQVPDHRGLIFPGCAVAVQDLADDLRLDDGAALVGPPGGAVDELALQGQQLRGRVAVDAKAAVARDLDGPLLEEPVGRRLDLSERLLRAWRDGQALGQGVHHVCPGEGGHLSGLPVRTGQCVQHSVQLRPSRWTAPATRAHLGQLSLTHPLLSEFGRPAGIEAVLGLAVVLGCPGRDRGGAGRLDAGQAMGVQPLVDLLRPLGEPLDELPVV